MAVEITSRTWQRESVDLFDFEATADSLHETSFTVEESAWCVCSGRDVHMLGEKESKPPCDGDSAVLRLVKRGSAFSVDKASWHSSRKLWLVVRDQLEGSYRLSERDTIRLGRLKFRIRQLALPGSGAVPDLGLEANTLCHIDTNPERQASRTCRICLLEGSSAGDPLIAPCRCKGSVEYVHLGCLRHWIKSQWSSAERSGSYFFKPPACELCKNTYATYLHDDGQCRPLAEVPTTEPPFVVLEGSTRDHNRGLHVISLAEKPLKFGRGRECDVRLADVSISRDHAMIQYRDGRFFLEDCGSKFGTLVAMRRPLQLGPGMSAASLQVGNRVMSLSLRQPAMGASGGAATR